MCIGWGGGGGREHVTPFFVVREQWLPYGRKEGERVS
jgi:hypothetical protein